MSRATLVIQIGRAPAMRRLATSRDGAELDVRSSVFHSNSSSVDASSVARSSHQVIRESSTRWSNFDSHVSCLADGLRSQQFTLPWETGYAGMVLSNKMPKLFHVVGDSPMHVGRTDFILATTSASPSVSHVALLPKLPGHVRKLKLMSWHTDPDDLQRRALNLVRIMVESDLSATQLGKMMHNLSYSLADELKIQQLISDTFARKSPATLYKRARALWKYFEWMQGGYSQSLHLSEDRIYQYVCHLREQNCAPTSAQSFIEALNFFSSLIGFVSCDIGLAISARVKGVVHTLSLQKRQLKQARALRVTEVAALEELVLQPASPVLSIMAGFFLFCVMNCCRFNDAQFAENLTLDVTDDTVILHAGTCQHKTATTADKRTTLLPLVCLGHVFAEESWASKWVMLMQAEGWSDDRSYLLPAYSEYTGQWLSRKMTSGEGSLWLRECLAAKDFEVLDDIVLPTTHSCKATLLSWLAKSGKFEMIERQILGHHLDRPSVSALTYGRQNFIPILTKVALLLRRINDGSFAPDAHLSRIVRQSLAQMEEESQRLAEQMGLQSRVEEQDDSASEAADQEDIEIAASRVVPVEELRQVAVDDPATYEQHRLSGVIHLIMDDGRFACGRVRSLNYLSCEPVSVFGTPLCEQCRNSHFANRGS